MRGYDFVGLEAPCLPNAWLVRRIEGHLCIEDHLLHFTPEQLLLTETGCLSLLRFGVLEEQHTNEEVVENEAAYQNEDDEENCLLNVTMVLRSIVQLRHIESLIHYGGPTLERRNHKETHHRLAHVVKVGVVALPFAPIVDAVKLVLVFVLVDAAVEEVALVLVNAENGKHEPHNQNDDYDVENGACCVKQCSHDHLELQVVRDDAQRTQHSQHAQYPQRGSLLIAADSDIDH